VSDRVDQVKTTDVRVERGSGGLGGWPVEDGSDTCQVAGDVYGVHYSWVVWWFGPQNHQWPIFTSLGLKTRVEVLRRNGRHVVASRSSRWGKAIPWRARWPSDENYLVASRVALVEWLVHQVFNHFSLSLLRAWFWLVKSVLLASMKYQSILCNFNLNEEILVIIYT
jgi:hypothetical protein